MVNKKIKANRKTIVITTLLVSACLSLISDFTYGPISRSSSYMFGAFLNNLSGLMLSVGSIVILFSLIFPLLSRLNPIILDKIKFEDNDNE